MKIRAGETEAFLEAPGTDCRAVLIYGPDAGMVQERADRLCRGIVPDPTDPFRVADFGAQSLRDDPARLADEAAALALTGGRRVVRVRDAGDTTTATVKDYLNVGQGDATVILTGGDLGPRSSLRRLFEAASDAAAIACYADDAGGLRALITEVLGADQIAVEPDALDYLVQTLGADRGLSRRELEKLALWAGPSGTVGLADAVALIGDSGAASLDEIAYAALAGDFASADAALSTARQIGLGPVPVLRAVSGLLMRVQTVSRRAASGENLETVVKSLKPPVFFKLRSRFDAIVRRWTKAGLADAFHLVLEAEAACKRTGAPDWPLCGRAVQQVAALARRQGRTAQRA